MPKTSKTRIPPSSDVSLRVWMPGRFGQRQNKKVTSSEAKKVMEEQHEDAVTRGVVKRYDHAGNQIS